MLDLSASQLAVLLMCLLLSRFLRLSIPVYLLASQLSVMSVAPAGPVLPAADSAPAMRLSACGGLRHAASVLYTPEVYPPSVPAEIQKVAPVLCAAEVLLPVASASAA